MSKDNTDELENITHEVSRLEDLIRLYIEQEKEGEKMDIEFAETKLDFIKISEKRLVSVIGLIIALTVGLVPTTELTFNDVIGAIILEVIILFVSILSFSRWNHSTALTLGELIGYHRRGIINFETILEFIIISTIKDYNGKKNSVLTTSDAIIILNSAHKLYSIVPLEKTSKLFVFTNDLKQSSASRAIHLRKNAQSIYSKYMDLELENIPIGIRGIICSLFTDLADTLDLKPISN